MAREQGAAAPWTEGQILAWTEREGPGRPPRGGHRGLHLALAATLGVVFAGMLVTDTLCPEHRAWVQSLATVALVGTGAAAVGLARGWAVAPLLTLGVASLGLAIGALDAVHDPARGQVLLVAFALVAVAAAGLGARQARLARWGRQLRSDLAPSPERAHGAEAGADPATPAPPVPGRAPSPSSR